MARVSQWSRLRALEDRLPRTDSNPVVGIVRRILGTGPDALKLISGLSYRSCHGHQHPLDGQSIDFGELGIPPEDLPPRWDELMGSLRDSTAVISARRTCDGEDP